jgi:hypothetical protein
LSNKEEIIFGFEESSETPSFALRQLSSAHGCALGNRFGTKFGSLWFDKPDH